ncbi:DgyrCDS12571 [Dimorphilus gyrociliatus]|uniref:DgyrCDS12571 n=1 Tax=Dimorphilus gyrociliatus TaxID=2664684 RepID=A0A7I8W7W8_9ANNE|nr:DgyrCDS12571 [Dimorphilus gyrociliatus]
MAKWGEGDPRWIVEERADAKNVNNWHWTEKNATSWSQTKIKELLENLEIQEGPFKCVVTEIKSVEGEAVVNNRKARLIFFYEWVIKCSWKGSRGDGDLVKGKFDVLNLSDEYTDINDIDINVSIDDEKIKDAWDVKEFMRHSGTVKVREQLAKYLQQLKEQYSEGLILPTKNSSTNTSAKKTTNEYKNEINKPIVSSDSDVGIKIPCQRVSSTEFFKCEACELYSVLTDQGKSSMFTRSKAILEAEKGGKFALFDGNVQGEFTDLVLNEKIVMKWRFQSWPDAHYSTVSIYLKQKDDGTELQLTQTGVPKEDYERTVDGWKNYYWRPIMQAFGFGAGIYG